MVGVVRDRRAPRIGEAEGAAVAGALNANASNIKVQSVHSFKVRWGLDNE